MLLVIKGTSHLLLTNISRPKKPFQRSLTEGARLHFIVFMYDVYGGRCGIFFNNKEQDIILILEGLLIGSSIV